MDCGLLWPVGAYPVYFAQLSYLLLLSALVCSDMLTPVQILNVAGVCLRLNVLTLHKMSNLISTNQNSLHGQPHYRHFYYGFKNLLKLNSPSLFSCSTTVRVRYGTRRNQSAEPLLRNSNILVKQTNGQRLWVARFFFLFFFNE